MKKEYLYHYKVFEHIQIFEIVFLKSVDAVLILVIWKNIEYLYLIDYYKL